MSTSSLEPLFRLNIFADAWTAFSVAYYSPLLLLTIPGSRNGDPRWDAGAILDIVLFCLSQQNKQNKGSGVKLLSQVRVNHPISHFLRNCFLSPFIDKLISLTSTTRFDLTMFVRTLCGRVPIEDWPSLQTALEYLPEKQAYLHFKLLVCIQYLGHLSRSDGPVKGKRAAPRARGARAEEKRPEESNPGDSLVRTFIIPNWKSTVGPLVSVPHKGQNNVAIYYKIKYELLVAYALLNDHQKQGGRDIGWDEELRDGSLRRTIETVFGSTVIRDEGEAAGVKFLGELLGDILLEAK